MARRTLDKRIPKYPQLIQPTVDALMELGGSGSIQEIADTVAKIMALSDEIIDIPHFDNSPQSEYEYQLAWARTYLRNANVIQNSARGIWSINPEAQNISNLNIADILRSIRNTADEVVSSETKESVDAALDNAEVPEEIESWRIKLHEVLLQMNPYSFEKLAQRLLRECGFSQVQVTRKSGDGGIDGTGKLRINGIFSFNVAFQCKRYQGVVGAPDIRDFRGSLTTHVEKGVFITTGTFSKAARDEAADPAKQQIDLIDGEDLINKLQEYSIGVKEVKDYIVDENYFFTL